MSTVGRVVAAQTCALWTAETRANARFRRDVHSVHSGPGWKITKHLRPAPARASVRMQARTCVYADSIFTMDTMDTMDIPVFIRVSAVHSADRTPGPLWPERAKNRIQAPMQGITRLRGGISAPSVGGQPPNHTHRRQRWPK